MQLSAQNAFQVIFPKYLELLTQSPLYNDDGLQTFIRDELPHKVELVRSIEPTFLAFQTQFTNLILKRPKQQNLIQSLTLKASQKIQKLFYHLETTTDKQVNKSSLNNELSFLNIQEIRTKFREKLKDLGPLLKEKYFDSHHLDKTVEEQVARRLYCISELYYFLKNDLTSIAGKFRIKEHEVLTEINKPGSSGASSLEIGPLVYLDEKLMENIREIVDKRYRPFLGKKDFFYSKVKQIQNESQSKVPINIHTLVQSILSKEKYRSNKQITASLAKELKTTDESLEQQTEKDCKQLITEVDSLKKEFNQLKNNIFYLDIIRGTFTDKYKMELNKLENVYYLSNIEKYLQDVQTFTEKLISIEERIIDNRKTFMRRFGKQIQDKIASLTSEYQLKNANSWQTLVDLVENEFAALKDNLYGIIVDTTQTNSKPISNQSLETLKQQKVNELEKRRFEVQRARQEKQLLRKRQLEQKAEKQRLKRQQDRIKLQEKRRAEDDRIRKMKQERQQAEKIRKIQQVQKQQIRQIQIQEKRKLIKLKQQQERQRVRQQIKRKDQEKKLKQIQDAKLRDKLKSQKEISQKIKLEQAQNKRKQAEQIKRKKQQQQKLQQQRLRDEKEKMLKVKKDQQQRQQRQRQQRVQQQKQQRQRKQRQLKAQRDRQQQQKREQQEKQKRQRENKLQREKQQKQLRQQQQRERKDRQRQSQLEREKAQAQDRQKQRKAKFQKEKIQREQKEKRQREQRQKGQRQQRERRERQQRQNREKKERQEREQRQRKQQQERQRRQRERKQKQQREERQREQKLLRQKQQRQQKEQRQRREKQEQQQKQKQRKQQLQRQKQARQKQERQRKAKEQQNRRKQQEQREKRQLQLLMEQEDNIKKNKSKVSNDRKSKNGSGINYDDLDDIIDDDLQQLDQQDAGKGHGQQLDNDEDEYGNDYEDDFESPDKDEEGSGATIEPKELITAESVKCLNDYMKGTPYARKNKPNLEPFNNKQSYAYLFEEFSQCKKLFIFDSAVSKAVLEFSKELLNQNALEEDLKISIETIKEEMFNDYASKLEEESFDPRTILILPFNLPNEFDLKLIEFLPEQAWFRPVLGKEIEDEQTEAKFNSLLEGLLHIFEIENEPQVQSTVIPEASRMVLQTFDKDLPSLLLIFALHYETELKQTIEITQYTVERFFYTIQVLKPYYETIENNQEELVKFYDGVHEKYAENEPIRILPIDLQSADPDYEAKLQQYSLQAKQMFTQDTKITTLLVLFQVLIAPQEEEQSEGNFEKILIYCSLERTSPKPIVSYYLVSKDDVDKENALVLFDLVSEGDEGFEVNVFMDFTRHNGLTSYADWTLPLWARTMQKRKLTAVNAFRAIAFAMTPYYVAFKEQD